MTYVHAETIVKIQTKDNTVINIHNSMRGILLVALDSNRVPPGPRSTQSSRGIRSHDKRITVGVCQVLCYGIRLREVAMRELIIPRI